VGLVTDIMDAMATSLAGLPNCNQVWPRMNLEPDEPCIDIYPSDPFEEVADRGFGHSTGGLLFTVRARVGVVDYQSGQDILLEWMDYTNPFCVAALLEDDQTLGGKASSVDVGSPSGYISFVDLNGKIQRLGATWHVRVLPAHS
jgi:hypothetical protein